jgi:hypothetical protein
VSCRSGRVCGAGCCEVPIQATLEPGRSGRCPYIGLLGSGRPNASLLWVVVERQLESLVVAVVFAVRLGGWLVSKMELYT